MKNKNLLGSRYGRFLTFGLLYVSEGIPVGFTTVAMVAFMRQQGASLEQIGAFTAAMYVPWAFKWAWAPLVDLVRLDGWGGRRGWIIGCTVMMLVTLLIAANIDALSDFRWLIAMITLHNIFAATQDVAIDSLAVSTLQEDERARGNGVMFAGQYLGITLGGGGAIFVSGLFGLHGSLAFVAALSLLNLAYVLLFVYDPYVRGVAERTAVSLRELGGQLAGFGRELYGGFLRSGRGPKLGVVFALLPTGAIALAYATLSTIQVDYGLEESQIAQLSVFNTIAAGLGCLIGGVIADRYGVRRIVGAGYAATAVVTFLLATQIAGHGLTGITPEVLYGSIIFHGFVFGVSYGCCNAIFMGMTNPAVAATQFTAFMGLSNLAVAYTNYWQGIVAERLGYATVLYFDAAIALLVISIIPFLRPREAPVVRVAPVAVAAAPLAMPARD